MERARLALMMGAPWANAVQLSLPHHFSFVRLVLARAPLNSWEAEGGFGRMEGDGRCGGVENCGQQSPESFTFCHHLGKSIFSSTFKVSQDSSRFIRQQERRLQEKKKKTFTNIRSFPQWIKFMPL